MNKEIDKLWDEVVTYSELTCSHCQEVITEWGAGDIYLAEKAFEKGWHIGRTGTVICPKCDRRRKKT